MSDEKMIVVNIVVADLQVVAMRPRVDNMIPNDHVGFVF